jgi:hypothetical protein
MPTVPGEKPRVMGEPAAPPTPEQVLITAADMHQRGQLTEGPTTISDPRAPLKLPFAGGGRGQRISSKSKRR